MKLNLWRKPEWTSGLLRRCCFICIQLIMAVSITVMAQTARTIQGTVTDVNGEPIIGASVIVKGTTKGVITDVDGHFVLDGVGAKDQISVSYIGYDAYEFAAVGKNNFSIVLQESSEMIDEVVVIGYGTVRKSDLTGSISSLSSKNFERLPQNNVTNILQGKAAGVNITTTSGAGANNIRIRGITSLNKSSEPLWVVDGVIGGTIGNVNDIESIEVLKDASSTSIYGSQGANGVILVTTKKPQEGTHVTFDTRIGLNTIRKKPDLMNAYEYATALSDIQGASFSAEDMAAYKNGTKGIDWFDLMTQTGITQSYNLNISGGTKKTQYAISSWVNDKKGQWITSKAADYNLKAQLNSELFSWLDLSTYMYGSISDDYNPSGHGQFDDLLEFSPTMELMNSNGVYNLDPYGSLGDSPMGAVMAENETNKSYDVKGFANLKFKIIDGLTFSVEGLYSHSQSTNREFTSSKLYPNCPTKASMSSSWSDSWRNINNLTYQKDFGDHRLTAMGVVELTQNKYIYQSIQANNLTNESNTYWDLSSAEAHKIYNSYSNSAMSSAFGRVIYSYQGKYLFTGTFRADAASQFQKQNRWGYFPSVALGWNVSEEKFVNKDILPKLKLRASAGSIGNQGVSPYSTYATLSSTFASYGTGQKYVGFWPETSSNPDLRWEKTWQYDVGFDIGVLDNRLSLTTDFYLKNTTDLLFQKELPDYNGGGTVWTNLGKLRNKGMEYTLTAIPFATKDFSWESTLTASYTDTKVVDLGDVDEVIPDASRGGMCQGGLFILKEGESVGTFYLQEWAGFDDEGANLYRTKDGGTTTENNVNNRKVAGNSIPKWQFGWQNTFTYKDWDFGVLFRATSKYGRLNLSRYVETAMVGASRFISTREGYYRSWDKVADKSHALFPSLTNSRNQYVPGSTQWLENAMFLRCQNLTVGYTVPKNVIPFAQVRLAFNVENLFLLSNYSGLDPETISETKYQDTTFGLDWGSFPIPRTFIFSLSFKY